MPDRSHSSWSSSRPSPSAPAASGSPARHTYTSSPPSPAAPASAGSVVVRIRLRRLRPLLPRQPVPHRVVRIRRGRPVVRRRDQAVAQVILVRPRLGRAAGVRLRHRFGQDVPVPVVRQVRLLPHRPRLPVHVRIRQLHRQAEVVVGVCRIRQLHRQAEVVVGVCQFGCQGAARQERRVVRDLLDLPVRIVRIRADQLAVVCRGRRAGRARPSFGFYCSNAIFI